MPELAEVAFYASVWAQACGQRVHRVEWHPQARVFRELDHSGLIHSLTGADFCSAHTHGKQMLFVFSSATLGLHLGMSGSLRCEAEPFTPDRHDHLTLHCADIALVFSDPRQFGCVRLDPGSALPEWWQQLPPTPLDKTFRPERVLAAARRCPRRPLKAFLLDQALFPGIGNWMADEILWRSRLLPNRPTSSCSDTTLRLLWRVTREVSRQALRTIGKDGADPPPSWLFPHRWKDGGRCPRCHHSLTRATVGGRTTCWCEACCATEG